MLCITAKWAGQCLLGVIRVVLGQDHKPVQVRSAPKTGRKFKALVFIAMCHKPTMQCSKHRRYAMVLGAPTLLGSRIVKVDPRPGSLSTVISPPIIWQNRLLIASPRPVPPYLLAVAEEAWENS